MPHLAGGLCDRRRSTPRCRSRSRAHDPPARRIGDHHPRDRGLVARSRASLVFGGPDLSLVPPLFNFICACRSTRCSTSSARPTRANNREAQRSRLPAAVTIGANMAWTFLLRHLRLVALPPDRGDPMTSIVPPPPPPLPSTAQHLPPPPPPPLIVVDHVSKWFGDLVAVSDVTFAIGPGVTALLGPNGAGKSTLMRMLCGLTAPAQGTVRVLGRDPRRDTALSRQLGIVPQQEALFEVQTAFEFVRLAAVLQHSTILRQQQRGALALVELDPHATRRVAAYSKGMRQRVKVAQAVVHDPRCSCSTSRSPVSIRASACTSSISCIRSASRASAWSSRATCSTRSSASVRGCSSSCKAGSPPKVTSATSVS